jgi:hypothetical protein
VGLPRTPPVPTGLDAPGADILAFLDYLEQEHFSGYLTWAGPTAEGRLLLHLGQVIEAVWDATGGAGSLSQEPAMQRFLSTVREPGAGRYVGCYPLDPGFVWSYSALAGGHDRPQDRNLTGVQWPLLVQRATGRRLTGAVRVTVGPEVALLFLCQGRALGEYRPTAQGLEEAAGAAPRLCAQPGSRVDVYTARERAELPSLNHVAWPVERVAEALGREALTVLGPRGQQVVKLLNAARHDPQALRAACTRARQVTRIFIGAEEYEELGRRMDHHLARLR